MKRILLFFVSVVMIFLAGCQKDTLQDLAPTTDDPAVPVADRARFTRFPDVITLPTGFQVEGIEIGEGTTFYASSLADGSIFKGDLKTGQGSVFNTPNGFQAVGMSYDKRTGLLFVAGGGGQAFVYDGDTGELVASYNLAAKAGADLNPLGSTVNDVIVTYDAAYFTDSYNTFLYKVPLGRGGALPASEDAVEVLHMDGFVYTADPNFFLIEANGIVSTDPLGRQLIVNNMATGIFYLVNTQTGLATPIDIPGVDPSAFTWGDGLLLAGHTLYVCQNFPNKIAVIELSPDFTTGTWVKDITQENFVEPATIARFDNNLYAVNAHFFEFYILGLDPSTLPYEVVKVRL